MKVLITGARGMLGRHIASALADREGCEVVGVDRDTINLEDSGATAELIASIRPTVVVHAAAFVAGVQARVRQPADFLDRNLRIDESVASASIEAGVPQLLYISSAGVYPTSAAQPIAESSLLSGPPEASIEPYGLAKIIGIKRCEYLSQQHGVSYRAIVPSNLYGPGEHIGGERAHLIAAALEKVHNAARGGAPVEVWGDGTALREFTYAGDLAHWIAEHCGTLGDLPPVMNIGSGDERTIREYYATAAEVIGYDGPVTYDVSRPAGAARRLLDSSVAREHGWAPRTDLLTGMTASYRAYLEVVDNG